MHDVVGKIKEWEVSRLVKEGLGKAKTRVLDRVDRAVRFLEEIRKGYNQEIVLDKVDPKTKDQILDYIHNLGLRYNQSGEDRDTLVTIDVSPILDNKEVFQEFILFLQKEKNKLETGRKVEEEVGAGEGDTAEEGKDDQSPALTEQSQLSWESSSCIPNGNLNRKSSLQQLVTILKEKFSSVGSCSSTISMRGSVCPNSLTSVANIPPRVKVPSVKMISRSENFFESYSRALSKMSYEVVEKEQWHRPLKKRRPGGLRRMKKGIAKVCRKALGAGGGGDCPSVVVGREYKGKGFSVLRALKKTVKKKRKWKRKREEEEYYWSSEWNGQPEDCLMRQLALTKRPGGPQTDFLVYPVSIGSSNSTLGESNDYQRGRERGKSSKLRHEGMEQWSTGVSKKRPRDHSTGVESENPTPRSRHANNMQLNNVDMGMQVHPGLSVVKYASTSMVSKHSKPDDQFNAAKSCNKEEEDKKSQQLTQSKVAINDGVEGKTGLCRRLAGFLGLGSGGTQLQLKEEIEKQREEIEMLKSKLEQCLVNLSSIGQQGKLLKDPVHQKKDQE